MKNLFYLLVICSLFNCKNTDDNDSQASSLVGNWKLIEEYVVDGVNGNWVTVLGENSYHIQLFENSTFSSTKYNECEIGTYSFINDELTFDYGCDGFTIGVETPEGVFVENYQLLDEFLFLTPTYLSCFEGCGLKFIKLIEE